MSERGVFAVDRGIWDHPVFEERTVFSKREAWLWLLSEAEWKDVRRNVGGKVVALKRGQLAHSIRFMGEAWGWDKAKVARFLDRLNTETMIETHAETAGTIITICKYDEYQRVALPKRDTNAPASETAARHPRDRLESSESIEIEEGANAPLSEPPVADAPSSKPTKSDLDAALTAYTETAKRCDLPVVRVLNDDRRRKLSATLRRHGLAVWREALAIVEATPFLNGTGGKEFRASLDFLLQPGSFIKVIERQYGKANGAHVPSSATETPADWRTRLEFARRKHEWATFKWGPPPGQPGCRVPSDLLELGDGNGWDEMRSAA